MSEMINRVAQAIADVWCEKPGNTEGAQLFEKTARAAMEAMREPTHNVIMAAKNVIDEPLLKERQISLVPGLMYQAWSAGIDEALREP